MDAIISATGLRKHFGSVRAVDTIDLQVPKGSIYAFLGPNGAGKTTTIRLLLGLAQPDAGAIQLFGRQVSGSSAGSRTGSMVEGPSLYPHLTGQEMLRLGARLHRKPIPAERIPHLLKMLELNQARNRLIRTYSHGMKQRLGLALALLHSPELLILDEPTNGLDPAGIQQMRQLLKRLPEDEGITVFLSSHLLDEVKRVATHVGIIKQGRLLFQGSLQALLNRSTAQLEIGCNRPDEAASLLQSRGHHVEKDDGLLRIDSPGTSEEIAAINKLLNDEAIPVHHLVARNADMETLFNQLTAEEEEAG